MKKTENLLEEIRSSLDIIKDRAKLTELAKVLNTAFGGSLEGNKDYESACNAGSVGIARNALKRILMEKTKGLPVDKLETFSTNIGAVFNNKAADQERKVAMLMDVVKESVAPKQPYMHLEEKVNQPVSNPVNNVGSAAASSASVQASVSSAAANQSVVSSPATPEPKKTGLLGEIEAGFKLKKAPTEKKKPQDIAEELKAGGFKLKETPKEERKPIKVEAPLADAIKAGVKLKNVSNNDKGEAQADSKAQKPAVNVASEVGAPQSDASDSTHISSDVSSSRDGSPEVGQASTPNAPKSTGVESTPAINIPSNKREDLLNAIKARNFALKPTPTVGKGKQEFKPEPGSVADILAKKFKNVEKNGMRMRRRV